MPQNTFVKNTAIASICVHENGVIPLYRKCSLLTKNHQMIHRNQSHNHNQITHPTLANSAIAHIGYCPHENYQCVKIGLFHDDS